MDHAWQDTELCLGFLSKRITLLSRMELFFFSMNDETVLKKDCVIICSTCSSEKDTQCSLSLMWVLFS